MTSPAESQAAVPIVLVVDDEEDIVAYLTAVLEDNGFRAVGARDAAAALEAARREHPDLILLDIMMPGRTGLSLYREIRRNRATAHVPIFIISGYSREEELARMVTELEVGESRLPNGYLEKPISVPRFLQRLHDLFERQRQGCRHG